MDPDLSSPIVDDTAPDISLLRTDGTAVKLYDLIDGRPTVFFFLRHYA
jgi:hypothetical protein